ncbi:oxidoreductase domain protein [Thermobaculum terrenum ATCC BAA-798]|uniref:Oxidoreductase domain protein n=1 Tax=Thermobaculum terrenum (strain ATCC BAA-798 / CCMEE 7001 / YNP1) TaxID=525904 RepID=D1CE40_THET1|nr:Gfo/Idh/MocA family oxidoreductase [Thermobaculum terrenum]ACZ41196.1 oxidoreductase domain protein [Thermobaculum terrenum ATCC BAA-798]
MSFKIGIIGCGRIVEEGHAPALSNMRHVAEVVALADPSPERRATIENVLNYKVSGQYSSWKDLLENTPNLDAVLIALPHHLHEPAITDAARFGVNVISEKPLAATLEEVDRIGAVIKEHNVKLAVIHNYTYSRPMRYALRAIQEGRVGEVFLVRSEGLAGSHYKGKDPSNPDWRTQSTRGGGGVLLDNGYHNMYVAEAEAQSPVIKVYARVGRYVREQDVDDLAVVMLTHENGATTVVEVAWAVNGGGAFVHEVHGKLGSIRFKIEAPFVEIYENKIGQWLPLSYADDNFQEGFHGVLQDIFNAWAQGEDAPTNLAKARHNLAILRAAYLSAQQGTVVDLKDVER